MKILAIAILTLTVGFSASAQTKTVTNADLEKYRQARLESEKDLRENYRELGFPSPAELDKYYRQQQTDLEKLAARLQQEELERRQLALQAENLRLQNSYWRDSSNSYYQPSLTQPYFYGYSDYGYFNQPVYKSYPRYFPRRRAINQNPIGGGYAVPSPFFNRPPARIVRIRPR